MGLGRLRVSSRTLVFSAVLLGAGALLLAAGWLLAPITEAQQAVRDQRLPQALDGYRIVERRFASFPLARRLMPRLYDRVLNDELSVMYALNMYDDVVDKAGATGTPSGTFWAGCALFVKADLEILTNDKRLKLFAQAQQEFRRAVEHNPADFDAKFNYELAGKLVAALQKDAGAERPKALNLLRPSNAQSPKKVG